MSVDDLNDALMEETTDESEAEGESPLDCNFDNFDNFVNCDNFGQCWTILTIRKNLDNFDNFAQF